MRPPYFDGLNGVDAATAKRRFQIVHVLAGEVLVEEGSIGRSLYALMEGELEIRAGGTVLGRAGPGSLLGETALFEDSERTATVVATGPSIVWTLDRQGYEELRDTLHPICRNLEITAISEQVVRLHDVGDRVAAMALGSAPKPLPTGFFAAVRRLLGVGAERATTADVRGALERSSLFADAPQMVLDELAGRFRSLRCSGGTFLCTEGERGGRMFLLDEGEVEVVVASDEEPKVVDTLVSGQAFGMVSLASGAPRMSSCVARGDALVHELSAAVWAELTDDPTMVGSAFRRAVIRALADQLRHSNGQLFTAATTGDPAAVDAARSGM